MVGSSGVSCGVAHIQTEQNGSSWQAVWQRPWDVASAFTTRLLQAPGQPSSVVCTTVNPQFIKSSSGFFGQHCKLKGWCSPKAAFDAVASAPGQAAVGVIVGQSPQVPAATCVTAPAEYVAPERPDAQLEMLHVATGESTLPSVLKDHNSDPLLFAVAVQLA